MLYWYVLFVVTGREHHVINIISKISSNNILRAFVPTKEMYFKKQGKLISESRLLFPGYVFIETDLDNEEFFRYSRKFVKKFKDIIKLLKYIDTNEYSIRNNECELLKNMLDTNYCISSSEGFIEGDKIYIQKGPLKGRESFIKKIDRHKMEALIELEIIGGIRQVRIGLEVLHKI